MYCESVSVSGSKALQDRLPYVQVSKPLKLFLGSTTFTLQPMAGVEQPFNFSRGWSRRGWKHKTTQQVLKRPYTFPGATAKERLPSVQESSSVKALKLSGFL